MGRDSGGRCWRRSQGWSGTGLWGNGELPDCTRNPPAHVDSRMWWPLAGDDRASCAPLYLGTTAHHATPNPWSPFRKGAKEVCVYPEICISADTEPRLFPRDSFFNLSISTLVDDGKRHQRETKKICQIFETTSLPTTPGLSRFDSRTRADAASAFSSHPASLNPT